MNVRRRLLACAFFLSVLTPAAAPAQSVDPALFRDMGWRMIGPHRGGRTKAAAGVPGHPGLFYAGFVNGGVWKTTDYGRTWVPIFDDEPTGSIGALAVAPSDPEVIYVGSGEGMQRPDLTVGDGIYRSSDGGESWTHLGLRDGQQIPQIAVDPEDPDRLFVAVLGHPYGPNEQRGIFRSTDGGDTWEQIGDGLPTGAEGLGRIGIGIAASQPQRMYAIVGSPRDRGGLYRSEDGGENWARVNTDARLWGRDGDFNEVRVDPTDPDVVYVANVVTWKSTDGGRTFEAFRGAPGGDDYQRIWIDPTDPDVILLAADQGVVITVNGGESFSSWYNQPTAQFYHVSTDNAFPYRVCGGQQESGSACVSSRGDDGQITFREWHPVGVEEYGYVAPDPLDPDIVYGGKVSRFDRRTGDVQDVGPRPLRGDDYHVVRTQPILFSPTDPHTLYFASNVLWKTSDGGRHWQKISPDLTRTDSVVPPNVGKYADAPQARAHHPGVIYTIAPSYVNGDWIWAGTDDGLIQVTRDGGATWTDVTPEQLRDKPWSKISIMDASHTDTLTAYAAVNTMRLDDMRPHIYATHDGGRSWSHITEGIPDGGIANTVKEDPERPGLLFAGMEQAVYFSIDDGAHWQSLRLNMPATAIRDLVIKDNDLVVGTHGRSFWILDDITPLRQVDASTTRESALLFRPADAWRVRWNRWTDTPLPPDEPAGQNPPDGAILDYWLGQAPSGPVVLEIVDVRGRTVRRFSSDDVPEPPLEGQNVPPLWIRPPQRLSAEPGMHRFVWDLRYERPAGVRLGYPISAIPGNTPVEPRGPWALPGDYTVRLTVDGTTREQTLHVDMDPRIRTPLSALRQQFDLSLRIRDALDDIAAMEPADREVSRLASDLESLYRDLQASDAPPTPMVVELTEERLASLARLTGG